MIRNPYDGLQAQISEDSGTACDPAEGRTRQSEADAADINKIVARAIKTGVMPVQQREGLFIDVSEVGDYREAREKVRLANEYFLTLPAEARAIFNNDPAEFLDSANDPAQVQKLIDAGVIPKDELRVPAEGGAGAPAGAAAP